MHECATLRALTNHAVNGAEEHGALSGCRGLAEILQHQRAMAEDIDKLAEVEHPHLLQMLPLLVCGGGAEQQEKEKEAEHFRPDRKYWLVEHVQCEEVRRERDD